MIKLVKTPTRQETWDALDLITMSKFLINNIYLDGDHCMVDINAGDEKCGGNFTSSLLTMVAGKIVVSGVSIKIR